MAQCHRGHRRLPALLLAASLSLSFSGSSHMLAFDIASLAGQSTEGAHSPTTSQVRDFPDGPVAETPRTQCRGLGLIPAQGTRAHVHQQSWWLRCARAKTCCSQVHLKLLNNIIKKNKIRTEALRPVALEALTHANTSGPRIRSFT